MFYSYFSWFKSISVCNIHQTTALSFIFEYIVSLFMHNIFLYEYQDVFFLNICAMLL